jgi:molybdopterin-containing oxidoreductase family iron-sulfur binding subunit
MIPGRPTFYRSVCRACAAGCAVTVRTREGRAIKLEGSPDDPIGRGALCARGQAELQALYHPARWTRPVRRNAAGALAPIAWDEALAGLASTLRRGAGEFGRGRVPVQPAGGLAPPITGALPRVRFVTRPEPGTAGTIQRAFLAALGAGATDRVVVEPLDPGALRVAGRRLFGRAELPAFELGRARSVVSFGADFIETWLSPVELARGLASGRGRVGPERTRFTWIAPRLSLTGASADRWISVRPGGELAFALALLSWLLDPANAVPALAPEAARLASAAAALDRGALAAQSGATAADVAHLGSELEGRRPSVLLGPPAAMAASDAEALSAIVLLTNLLLGNVGATVLYGLDPLLDPPSPTADLDALLAELGAGAVDALFIHRVDLVRAVPGARAAFDRVPLIVSFAERPDATTELAHLVLPDRHALEAFGDVSPRKGVVQLGQPVMVPLADTRPASEVLLQLAKKLERKTGLDSEDLGELVAKRAAALAGDVRRAFERGTIASAVAPEPVQLEVERARELLAHPPHSGPEREGELDLVLFPTALRGDGRGADLPWLNEVPDPLSGVAWSSWVELSPEVARRFGAEDGDLLELETAARGRVELPLSVYAGLRDGAVAVPLGGPADVVLGRAARWVAVRRTGRTHPLARANGASRVEESGEILHTVSSAQPELPRPDLEPAFYGPPEHPLHRWGMAVDLDRCTGCQACVVACYAENNVPVMGPEAAAAGRNMAWIRLDQYQRRPAPRGRLEIDLLLMLCQQCSNAPCEPVCPVYATYHTPEGLNAQVYNRCVGTRYCSNNCPYKVRTFNWRDARFPRPLDLQLNPDVTVRTKGVMEKCTFCVQRIRAAENTARERGRPPADGEVIPACAEACPTTAIVFGDLLDPSSRVARASAGGRGFAALAELNTRPAITYLARIREGEP